MSRDAAGDAAPSTVHHATTTAYDPPLTDASDMSSDGDLSAAVPPPRVAARLNRGGHRPSASSSRRNSISSLHSSVSNRSGYSRSQSMHITQQLRRASILEDRKAKIAERNAHAELVRMRAQQAKAAPRTATKMREERALAAQQARERHLAQVASSGAEEVKRAKRIAEEAREKKAAETLKLREDMQEKHADAEKRRLQIQNQQNQRKVRGQSLANPDDKRLASKAWKPKSDLLAAQVIQQAWRNSRRRKVMTEYSKLNLDIETVQAQTFEAVTARVAETTVLIATTNMLKLCNLLNSNDSPQEREANVRIFLSAYLILGHPQDVLSKSGELEEDLISKAKLLLMQIQRLLSKPAVEKTFLPTSELMISLTEAYNDFLAAFTSWKTRDASFIIEGAIAQFVELDAIWQTVKNDTLGGVADDYKEGIRNNQATILVRLRRILGHDRALKMVNDAVKARRRSNAKKRSKDAKPRAAIPGVETASAAIRPDNTPGNLTSPPSAAPPAVSPADRTAQIDALNSVTSPLPDNRVVIHELAINRDFRIDVEATTERRQAISRAVFNAMRADVENGYGDKWVLAMAEMIRENLLRLVAPGKSFHSMISEFLDTSLIEKQLQFGNFSYEKFFGFMNNILPKLCAPVRDSVVKSLATDTNSDFIERLAKTLHVINLLSLDHSNYLLSASAPELIRRAPAYEQQCFAKDLSVGDLSRTTKWWRQSRNRAVADMARRSPDGVRPRAPTSSRIYTTGLIDLFLTLAPLNDGEIPETLTLDALRIRAARVDTLRMITISSILLTAKNLLKRDVRSQWKSQAQRMWDLGANAEGSAYMAILDSTSGTAMPPAVRASLTGTVETVLANARAAPHLTHAVMKVLLRKIRDHATARLLATSSEEKVRSASTASDVLGSGGLVEFVPRITALVEEMGRLRQVDWDAHGQWIDRVAASVETEVAAEANPPAAPSGASA